MTITRKGVMAGVRHAVAGEAVGPAVVDLDKWLQTYVL
jgi:hypothetical protein